MLRSDEQLYKQYFSGEEKAADELIEKYSDLLVLYIHGYIHDLDEAEDLMIEAFSNMFVKMRPVSEAGSFKAYLYKTARNLALRHKQKYRIPFLCLEELTFEPQSTVCTEAGFLLKEQNRQLYCGMEKLKKEYREALYLVYFEDMSYREAAVVMGKTEAQITKLLYRGKQNLKQILEQEGLVYANH